MVAGTILLCGESGSRFGGGMKRGTIAFLGRAPDVGPLPTFEFATRYRPTFLRLYLRHLTARGFPLPQGCWEAEYHRYCGDFLESGKGEVLLRAA
jgi:hypothetical protein